MEEKIEVSKSNSKLVSILTLAVTLVAGLLSNFLILSFIPVIGGIIAVLGQIYRKRSRINVGMSIAIISFFILNYNLTFSIINLSLMLIIFISMMIVWAFARHNIMTSEIKKDLDSSEKNKYIKEFELISTSKIFKKMLIALLFGFIGSFIALTSYTGTILIPSLAVPLALLFSGVFLLSIYLIAVFLPERLEEQKRSDKEG